MDIKGIDFSTGLKIEDNPKLQSIKNLNLRLFELKVKVKDVLCLNSKLLPVDIPDSELEPTDFKSYENPFCSIKRLHVILGNH